MDLNTMYQNGMGPMASFFAGQSAVKDQQMADAHLRAKQMENDQSAVMNPLNAQFRQGQINQQGAELPGIVGQSQSQASQGSYDTQTLVPKVAARFSQLGDQVGADGMRQMGRDGEIATQIAPVLKQFPPALHKEVATRMFQMYGGSPDSPILTGIGNVDDAHVAQSLSTVGAGMALASQDYLTKSNLEKQKLDSEKSIAQGHDAASMSNAHTMADSRVQAAEKKAQQAFDHMNMNQKMAFLSSRIASGDATDAEKSQYIDLDNRIKAQNAARVPTLPNNMTGSPTQIDSVTNPGGFDLPNKPGGAPQAAAVPHGQLKQVGTSGGRPVFEDDKGNRFIK